MHPLHVGPQVLREELVPGKAVGQRDRGRQDVGERQRAELGQRDRQGVDDGGHGACRGTVGGNAAHGAEDVRRRRGGRRPLPVDHDRVLAIGEIENDRHLAPEAEVGDLSDGRGEGGSHARVHCVAAAREHPHARFGREVTAGGDDAHTTDDFRPVGPR